jgi:hypothetical protein
MLFPPFFSTFARPKLTGRVWPKNSTDLHSLTTCTVYLLVACIFNFHHPFISMYRLSKMGFTFPPLRPPASDQLRAVPGPGRTGNQLAAKKLVPPPKPGPGWVPSDSCSPARQTTAGEVRSRGRRSNNICSRYYFSPVFFFSSVFWAKEKGGRYCNDGQAGRKGRKDISQRVHFRKNPHKS